MKSKAKFILTTGCLVTFLLTFSGLSTMLNVIGFNGEIDYFVGGFCLFLAFILAGIAGIILYFIADEIGLRSSITVFESGVLEKKHYMPSNSSFGAGVSLNQSNGQLTPVIIHSHTSARFILEIRLSSSQIVRLAVTESNYDCLTEGDSVNVSYRISTFSGGKHWSNTVQKCSDAVHV